MADTPDPAKSSDDLQREIDSLRRQLADAQTQAGEAKRDVYALLNQLFPYTPPTEEELNDMLHGPRGQPLIEIIEEYERHLKE